MTCFRSITVTVREPLVVYTVREPWEITACLPVFDLTANWLYNGDPESEPLANLVNNGEQLLNGRT